MTDVDESGASAWGLSNGYYDHHGVWQQTPELAVEAILNQIRTGEFPQPTPVWVVRLSELGALKLPNCHLRDESGNVTAVHDIDDVQNLSIGYYEVEIDDGQRMQLADWDRALRKLIVCPDHAPVPPSNVWGWSLQLYALLSKTSCGMGDFGSLVEFCNLAKSAGANFVLINPLHAQSVRPEYWASPYFASSRLFKDVSYLDIRHLLVKYELMDTEFGQSMHDALLTSSQPNAGFDIKSDHHETRIDRPTTNLLKRMFARQIFNKVGDQEVVSAKVSKWFEVTSYAREFVAFNLIGSRIGTNWELWPEWYQKPTAELVDRVLSSHRADGDFEAFIQIELNEQLASANNRCSIVADLAIGTSAVSADAWIFQDVLAKRGTRVGAPPDSLALAGQDWGIVPFDPWKLRSVQYEPFIALVRSSFENVSAIRIDHVLGLFRSWWITGDFGATEGVYVNYPWRDLLGILSLEAERAGCWIVGEDLGVIGPENAKGLADHKICSYRLGIFEDDWANPEWPEHTFLAMTTHDLPTTAGVIDKTDLSDQVIAGVPTDAEQFELIFERYMQLTSEDTTLESKIAAIYKCLSESPAPIVCVTVDDAMCAHSRPNMPSTVDSWDNWRIPLPFDVHDFGQMISGLQLVDVMANRRFKHESTKE